MSDKAKGAPSMRDGERESGETEVTHERPRVDVDLTESEEPLTPHQELLVEEAVHVLRPCAEEVVKRYWRFFSGGFLHIDDLLHTGRLALRDAARKFREEFNHGFAPYARCWVRGAMLKTLGVEGFHERVRRSLDMAEDRYGAHFRDDTYDTSKHDEHEGRRRYRAFANGLLAATFMAGMDEASRASASEHDEAGEQRAYEHALRVLVPAFGQLVEQERRLLALVYHDNLDLTEASKKLRVTYIWARRHHAKALEQLREACIAEGIDRAPRPAVLRDPADVLGGLAQLPANDDATGPGTNGPAKPGAG